MSTEQQRQQWRELAAAATPGEWEPRMDWGKDMTFEGDVFYYGEAQGPHLELDTWDVIGKVRADAAFIAAARAAVPQLLADVDALQAERDALAAELERVRAQVDDYGEYCYAAHTDDRWQMTFSEWQQAIENDAQPQAAHTPTPGTR